MSLIMVIPPQLWHSLYSDDPGISKHQASTSLDLSEESGKEEPVHVDPSKFYNYNYTYVCRKQLLSRKRGMVYSGSCIYLCTYAVTLRNAA